MDKRLLVWAIVASLLVAASVTAYGLYQIPKYEASAVVLVDQQGAAKPSQQLVLVVAKAVPTTPVAQAVVERLKLPKGSTGEVLNNISAEQDPGTMFIDVSYKDSNQKRAQEVANAIGQVVSQKISEVSPGANAITATVWEPATYPQNPVSPKPLTNGLIALEATLALSAVLIAVRHRSMG